MDSLRQYRNRYALGRRGQGEMGQGEKGNKKSWTIGQLAVGHKHYNPMNTL